MTDYGNIHCITDWGDYPSGEARPSAYVRVLSLEVDLYSRTLVLTGLTTEDSLVPWCNVFPTLISGRSQTTIIRLAESIT